MRFVSATIPGVIEKPQNPMVNQYRTNAQFQFGKEFGRYLAPLFGKNANIAATTCRIQIMGRHAHNHNGKADRDTTGWRLGAQNRWVHTRLQTFGDLAPNFHKSGPRADWIYSDCWAGADTILECFGLSLGQVLNAYGNVNGWERKILDLDRIIKKMIHG